MISSFIKREVLCLSCNKEPLNLTLLSRSMRKSGTDTRILILTWLCSHSFLWFNIMWFQHLKGCCMLLFRSTLVERMPVLDEATYTGRRAGSVPAAVSTSQGALPKLPNGIAKPTSAPLVDLLDLSSDGMPAPSSSGGDFLQDLLGVDLSPASQG